MTDREQLIRTLMAQPIGYPWPDPTNERIQQLEAENGRLRDELDKAREVTREKLEDATYAVASAHHPFPSGCLCGYKSARKRDVTEHILDQFIAALGGGDDA